MIYYGKNKVVVDYGSKDFQKCWTCKKACGGCSWSREFIPIDGWTAEKSIIPHNREHAETYKIIDCPEYIPDRRYSSFKIKE